jgi:hypothetical protein
LRVETLSPVEVVQKGIAAGGDGLCHAGPEALTSTETPIKILGLEIICPVVFAKIPFVVYESFRVEVEFFK